MPDHTDGVLPLHPIEVLYNGSMLGVLHALAWSKDTLRAYLFSLSCFFRNSRTGGVLDSSSDNGHGEINDQSEIYVLVDDNTG
jgi:hypothetical protein